MLSGFRNRKKITTLISIFFSQDMSSLEKQVQTLESVHTLMFQQQQTELRANHLTCYKKYSQTIKNSPQTCAAPNLTIKWINNYNSPKIRCFLVFNLCFLVAFLLWLNRSWSLMFLLLVFFLTITKLALLRNFSVLRIALLISFVHVSVHANLTFFWPKWADVSGRVFCSSDHLSLVHYIICLIC